MFRKKFRKAVSALFTAIGCMTVGLSAITASAGCNMTYTCENDNGAWVRTAPDTESEKIGLIHDYEMIQVTEVIDGWGQIAYTDSHGTELIGWTALDMYEPLILDDDYTFIDLPDDVRQSADKKLIYSYLAGEFGFNRAAADAVIVNMQAESRCNPKAGTIDTNGLPSFGLCQWNGARYDSLTDFCNQRGLNISSVDSQMKYLQYEFENSYSTQYSTMLATENNADGCYEASYYWASKFEVCSSDYWTERAETAYQYYICH